MLGIDPNIGVHETKTYPDVNLVRQCLRLVHPQKVAIIKAKFEKLLRDSFIYLLSLTNWVSNIFLVMKKRGTIRACVNYGTLIMLILSITILPRSLTIFFTNVLAMKYFHLWVDFSTTIRSTFTHWTTIKLHLFLYGAHFHIKISLQDRKILGQCS